MAVTTLDPQTALIVVDLQKGLLGYPTVHPIQDAIRRSAALAKAFRRHGLPVVLVNATGLAPGRTDAGGRLPADRPADFAEIVPELGPEPGDHLVSKQTWGAFMHTDLQAYLQGKGVTQVVLTGVATSIGVESTARQAYELGLNVTLATDAMTDMSAECHENSLKRIFPRLGESGTTDEILAVLSRR